MHLPATLIEHKLDRYKNLNILIKIKYKTKEQYAHSK